MPDGFFRANRSIGLNEISDTITTVFSAHPIQPGKNQGGVNNYVFDPTSASFTNNPCLLYDNFVNGTVRSLYPNPTGALRDALNFNLDNLYGPLKGSDCPQLFPFGQWGSMRDDFTSLIYRMIFLIFNHSFSYYFSIKSIIVSFGIIINFVGRLPSYLKPRLYAPHLFDTKFLVSS